MKNSTYIYVIDALSNMHVGSGEVNYGVVDNLIQRDPITTLPNINSSGLKGALREHFDDKSFINDIFGSAPGDDKKDKKQGNARFFEANLLSLPVRSDKAPYFMATSVEVIESLISNIRIFKGSEDSIAADLEIFVKQVKGHFVGSIKAITFDEKFKDAVIEIQNVKATHKRVQPFDSVQKIFGDNLVIVTHEILKELCDDNHLPVISRNNLENGVSKNLWYEQVLPRYSRLYFMLMDVNCNNENWDKFQENLENDVFQVGANASIGYGFCKFKEIANL